MFRPFEVRLQRADGSWMCTEILANNLLDDPSVQGIVVTVRDITERKLAEDRCARANAASVRGEAHYRRSRRPDRLVCRYLPDTTLTFVNRPLAEFFGRAAPELLGSRLIDLLTPAEQETELARLEDFGPATRCRPKRTGRRADGSVHWYQWTDRASSTRTARSSSSSRSVATSPSAAGPRCSPVTRRRSSNRWRGRAVGRDPHDHRAHRRRSLPAARVRAVVLSADGQTLQIGVCPSLPSGFWEAIDDLPVGPLALSSGTAATAAPRSRCPTSPTTRGGPTIASSRTPTTSVPRGRRRPCE